MSSLSSPLDESQKVILRERTQTQKAGYYMIPLTGHSTKAIYRAGGQTPRMEAKRRQSMSVCGDGTVLHLESMFCIYEPTITYKFHQKDEINKRKPGILNTKLLVVTFSVTNWKKGEAGMGTKKRDVQTFCMNLDIASKGFVCTQCICSLRKRFFDIFSDTYQLI